MIDMHALLKFMADQGASDLFLAVGSPPYMKIGSATRAVGREALSPGETKTLAYSIMRDRQAAQFEQDLEANLSLAVEGVGRYRVNAYYQRGEVGLVIRLIKEKIPDFATLGVPAQAAALALLKRGLVLLVGSAGSGKSTTLAAMIGYRSDNVEGHILTIEDPIEFLYKNSKSLVDQREVGIDTHTFGDALRNALRQAPDVIVIGEIRDRETAQHALAYAETGHLCISTLHANNANQAIERLIHLFPEESQRGLLMDLSLNLKGVISQRLIPSTSGQLALATEVLVQSAYVSDLILKGRIDEIKEAMAKSNEVGMHTFDQSLFDLYKAKRIDLETALRFADSHTDLGLRIKLSQGHSTSDAPFLTVSDFESPVYGRP